MLIPALLKPPDLIGLFLFVIVSVIAGCDHEFLILLLHFFAAFGFFFLFAISFHGDVFKLLYFAVVQNIVSIDIIDRKKYNKGTPEGGTGNKTHIG